MPSTFNVQQYLLQHPEVTAAFNDPASGQKTFYGTIDNFALANAMGNGTPEEKASAGAAQVIGSGGVLINNPQLSPNSPDSNPFGSSGLAGILNGTAQQGAGGARANPNTQEVMAAIQNGANQSSGTTATTGTQSQTGTQQNQSTQNQQQTGTQAGTTIGSTSNNLQGTQATQQTGQVGTSSTSTPNDTLGFGQLLQQQVPTAQAATSTQQDFLKGLVANGPANQQALTMRAVNQAVSGPGMNAAGDGAQSRAASDAAATVGVNSLNQQLEASKQLAAPTQTTNLATAANPYIGQSTTGEQATSNIGLTNTGQTNTGTTNQATSGTNTQNLTNELNSLNLSSLLNNTATNTSEQQAGTSSANSAQVGVGTVPENVQKQSGGCYVCTDYVDRGLMKPGAVRRAARWKLSQPRFRRSLVGYSIFGPFFARHHIVPRSVARLILHEECRLAGVRVHARLDAIVCHAIFHYGSVGVAVLTGRKVIKQCEPSMVAMLSRNNLIFEV